MRITSENLDETIQRNREIHNEIEAVQSRFYKVFNKYNIGSPEKQALHFLKDHYLIQVPIPDKDFGGAVKILPNGRSVPVINTAQPRVYQFFHYWHEIYHIIEEDRHSHELTTEFLLVERKADYFASQMLISKDLYDFYFKQAERELNFVNQIAICMDTFKAPYKAILISLYELAVTFHNKDLQNTIKQHFDVSFTPVQWVSCFQALALDDSLVKPSNIVDFGLLKKIAIEDSRDFPDNRIYQDGITLILSLEKKFNQVGKRSVHE